MSEENNTEENEHVDDNDGANQQTPQYVTKEDLQEALANAFAKITAGAPASAPKQEMPEITPEIAAAIKENPAKLIEIMNASMQKLATQQKIDTQKSHWDTQVYLDFPALKTDKAFQKKVAEVVQEWKATGFAHKDNPMLVYNAAKFAAQSYKAQASQTGANNKGDMSAPVGDRQGPRKQSSISDNNPYAQFAKMISSATGNRYDQKFVDGFKDFVAKKAGNKV